jgi:diguanylate cyclase (GGDEF)-like protein
MQDQKRTLKPFLSPMNAWAFSLGTSIGWGSLVITCSTYLSQAGPEGSVLGMLLGTAIMLVISRNFFYLIDCYPDCGGVYAYARDVFGYKVYLGEALLSVAAILITAAFMSRRRRLTVALMTGLVCLFFVCILVCTVVALVSLPVPFLGRTAIGWIVDVTTIGATLVYGFAAAAAFRLAGRLGDKKDRLFGLIGLVLMISNYAIISQRARESEEELGLVRDRANTDPLTGVKSKHAYAERESAVSHEVKEGRAEDFSVVVCDVNGLKHVNDTLGHKAGDEYIRAASRLICELYKHSPVYRVGGDEFVMILTGRDYEHREHILKELNVQVEANIEKGAVVVSVGMSDYRPGEDQDFHTVFERADGLMYQRKQQLKAMGARTR